MNVTGKHVAIAGVAVVGIVTALWFGIQADNARPQEPATNAECARTAARVRMYSQDLASPRPSPNSAQNYEVWKQRYADRCKP